MITGIRWKGFQGNSIGIMGNCFLLRKIIGEGDMQKEHQLY